MSKTVRRQKKAARTSARRKINMAKAQYKTGGASKSQVARRNDTTLSPVSSDSKQKPKTETSGKVIQKAKKFKNKQL